MNLFAAARMSKVKEELVVVLGSVEVMPENVCGRLGRHCSVQNNLCCEDRRWI